MNDITPDFTSLDPNVFIQIVEESYGKTMSGICRPYTSYINRVFELQAEDGQSLVAKFYRPGRWSREALMDEHDFLLELASADVPVIAPLKLGNGATLGSSKGISFALFPRKGGRTCDELNEEQWEEVGRLTGRVHAIGALKVAEHRLRWDPALICRGQIDHIVAALGGENNEREELKRYQALSSEFIALIGEHFKGLEYLRIHGDFHFANLVHRPEEAFFMIDFDDMVMGPAIQDLWMLLPGYRQETMKEIEQFAAGYETFREFPWHELKLIEMLRGMRFIHFASWCARQLEDPGFQRENSTWGSPGWVETEIKDLSQQMEMIREEIEI